MRTPVLSARALEFFESREPGSTQLQDGTRKVSNSSWMTPESMDSDVIVVLPEFLESRESLTFLELSLTAGDRAWTRWLDYLETDGEGPLDLVDFAKGEVIHSHPDVDAWRAEDDWVAVLRELGMNESFISRIMSPEWTEWRVSGTAKDWARECIVDRWEFLRGLDHLIQNPAKGFGRRTSTMSLDKKQAAKPSVPPRFSSIGKGKGKETPAPLVASMVEGPPPDVEGHKVFFKGGTMSRLQKVYSRTGDLQFSGPILSTPPEGFHGYMRALYLTTQYEVAWQYAKWKAKIVDGEVVNVGLLTIAIPNELLSSVFEVYGDLWRKFVWHNRVSTLPAELEYIHDFVWLVGPICRLSQRQIEDRNGPEELEVWKLAHAESSCQWFTSNYPILSLMNERCKGKVWITALDMH